MGGGYQLLHDIAHEVVREKIPIVHERYCARYLNPIYDTEEVLKARRLSTIEFKRLGKIDPSAVDERHGVLHFDRFLPISHFFASYDDSGKMVASARLIWKSGTSVDDYRIPLPMINTERRDELLSQEAGSIAEIGALAKLRGTPTIATLKLLRTMFAFADDHAIKTLVCGLDPKIYPWYKEIFGGALKRLSDEPIVFPGIIGDQVPLAINLRHSFGNQRASMMHHPLGTRAVAAAVRHFFKREVPTLQ